MNIVKISDNTLKVYDSTNINTEWRSYDLAGKKVRMKVELADLSYK